MQSRNVCSSIVSNDHLYDVIMSCLSNVVTLWHPVMILTCASSINKQVSTWTLTCVASIDVHTASFIWTQFCAHLFCYSTFIDVFKKTIWKFKQFWNINLPSQDILLAFNAYPVLHWHMYDPMVLMHFWSHDFTLHSFTSDNGGNYSQYE